MSNEHSNKNLCFSNAILTSYLRLLKKYQGTPAYQELLRNLEVNEEWLNDPNIWHGIVFHDRFIKAIKRYFPQEEDISFRTAEFVFKQKSMQIFSSMVSILLNPKIFWSRLTTSAARVNLYSTFEFRILEDNITYARGVLIQKYGDPSMVDANAALCDAAQGSGLGVLNHTGHKLLEFRERKCIKRGDSYCEYEYTWRKRPLIRDVLVTTVLMAGAFLFLFRLGVTWLLSLFQAVLVPIAAFGIFGRFKRENAVNEAFEYQQETLKDLRRISIAKEMLNRKLIEYQKQMNECVSLASVGEMSYRFAHDLGGPLTLLTLYTDEMSSTIKENFPNEERLLTYCRSIEEATKRMARLQGLFRMVARGNYSETLLEVDLTSILQDLLDLYRPFFQKNKITAVFDHPPGALVVSAYDGAIETILLNLIQNASTALLRSSKRHLSFNVSDSGDQVKLEIRDTGPGIDTERLENLWKRFGPTQGGSGFGLYNVKQMIDRLQGEVTVSSSSTGTCFVLMFRKRISATHHEVG